MTDPVSKPTAAQPGGSGHGAPAVRLRALEHAMRSPVGTLAASLELLQAAGDGQGTQGTLQIMARQVRLLTAQLEQLHDIGMELAAARE